MLRKMLLRFGAVAFVIPVAVSVPAMTVLAEENATSTVYSIPNSDVEEQKSDKEVDSITITDGSQAVSVHDGGNVVVHNDVTVTDENMDENSRVTTTVEVINKGNVEIGGDINSYTVAISVGSNGQSTETVERDERSVTVGGSVISDDAAMATFRGTVSVGENVSSKGGNGLYSNGSDVTVGGDVTGDIRALSAFYSSNIDVGGDVVAEGDGTKGTAIYEMGPNNIHVSGDVTGYTDGVTAFISKALQTEGNGNIVIEGKLDTLDNSDNASAIIVKGYKEEDFSSAEIIQYLPEITVYEIGSDNIASVDVETTDDKTTTDWNNAVAATINYIIHHSDEISCGDGTDYNKDYDLHTAKLNKEFEVSLNDGYELGENDNTIIKAEKVSDGKYRITLINPHGGIDLKAIKKAIETNTGEEVVVNTEESSSDSESTVVIEVETKESAESTGNTSAPTNAIVISSGSTASAMPLVEGAAAPSRAISVKISDVTPAQYQEAIITNIASTPAGTTFRVETDKVACFDRKMLQAFATKSTVDMEVVFTYNGQKLRVLIPAGYDITKLLDDKGYCGFLRLADILGSEVVG